MTQEPAHRVTRCGRLSRAFIITQVLTLTAVAQDLEFERYAAKRPDALAPKPGGLTERIEVQSTNDNIDYVVKAYTLQQGNAAEIFQIVLNAVSLEGGTVNRLAAGSSVSLGPTGVQTSYEGVSYLVVTMPHWMIPYVDDLIRVLDVPGIEASAFGTGYAFYRPLHRRPSELAAILGASVASPSAIAVPDDSRNVIYLEDTPSFVGNVVRALEAFDRPPDQVEVHVRIYEIDDGDTHDVGLDWYAWKKSVAGGDLSFVWGAAGGTDLNLESLSSSLSFTPQLATEFLNYLASEGRARIVTDTRLRVSNGESATIDSTTQIPYVIRGYSAGTVTDSNHLDSPPALDAAGVIKEFAEGVRVTLSPVIGDLTMELRIEALVASHVGYTPNQSVPIISTSTMASALDLTAQVPAILGGLTRNTKVRERSGIPGLKSIPGLRYLFSREVQREQLSQVFVVIVPTRVNQAIPSDMMADDMIPVWSSRSETP